MEREPRPVKGGSTPTAVDSTVPVSNVNKSRGIQWRVLVWSRQPFHVALRRCHAGDYPVVSMKCTTGRDKARSPAVGRKCRKEPDSPAELALRISYNMHPISLCIQLCDLFIPCHAMQPIFVLSVQSRVTCGRHFSCPIVSPLPTQALAQPKNF